MSVSLEMIWTFGSLCGVGSVAGDAGRWCLWLRRDRAIERKIAAYDEDVRRLAEHSATIGKSA